MRRSHCLLARVARPGPHRHPGHPGGCRLGAHSARRARRHIGWGAVRGWETDTYDPIIYAKKICAMQALDRHQEAEQRLIWNEKVRSFHVAVWQGHDLSLHLLE